MSLVLLLLACSDAVFVRIDCTDEDNDGDAVAGRYVSKDAKADVEDCEALGHPDCNDDDATVYPGAPELCDGIDHNCDGIVNPDADGDGDLDCTDCDAENPDVHAGAEELCNGVDDDCNGVVDDGLDADGDGSSQCDGDCDDADPTVYPGAPELCDGVDNNCDRLLGADGEHDDDGDGWRPCDGDCDDTDATRNPGTSELCNGVDDDCSGSVEASELDGDGDGARGCDDCDDADGTVHPGAPERCNGADDNCDGAVDEGWDADGDGFSACQGDCDDTQSSVYPGAPEACNGQDDDCDGSVDKTEMDLDGDGWSACDGDCAALDGTIFPGATELCNGTDDDCDGSVAGDEVDADADGAMACDDCDDADAALNELDLDRDGNSSCDGDCDDLDSALDAIDRDADGASLCDGDCDDEDPARAPSFAEACDFVDNDCDDVIDEGFVDLDGDGAAECVEVCNGVDDDSDGTIDEGYTDGSVTGVWVDATLPGGDGTAATPFDSIQAAIDARSPVTPCVIYVRPGTYFETVWVDGGEAQVVSTDGPDVTTIDAAADAPAFGAQSTPAGSRLEGFTLTGAWGTDGGGGVRVEDGQLDILDNIITGNVLDGAPGAGIFCRDCQGTISGNTIYDNEADFPSFEFGLGGGIAVQYSGAAVTIEDNLIYGNTLTSRYGFGGGIGVWATGDVWIQHNVIADNVCSYDGGGIAVRDGAMAYIENNILIGNRAEDTSDQVASGIALGNDAGSWLVNNTIVLNEGGYAQVVGSWTHGTQYFANNIVAFGDAGGIGSQGGTAPRVIYGDVYDNAAGDYLDLSDYTGTNGNLSADPLFVGLTDDGNGTNDDVSLGGGSPAIDAGLSSSAFDDVDGTRNDMGAHGGPGGSW